MMCEASPERNDSGTSGRLVEQAAAVTARSARLPGEPDQTTVSSQLATSAAGGVGPGGRPERGQRGGGRRRSGWLQLLECVPQANQQLFNRSFGDAAHREPEPPWLTFESE